MILFVSDTSQDAMIRNNFPSFEGVYALCGCGYREMDVPQDSDEGHFAACDVMTTTWKWHPLKEADCTPEYAGMLKDRVHYYFRDERQTSLRCSYCADAPTSTIHVTCTDYDCWNPATKANDLCYAHEALRTRLFDEPTHICPDWDCVKDQPCQNRIDDPDNHRFCAAHEELVPDHALERDCDNPCCYDHGLFS